jgi:hypothetical protein
MAEARPAQQLGVLRFGALPAVGGDEHLRIEQFRQVLARRIADSNSPCPPPTSTIVPNREKSYAATTVGVSIVEMLVIPSLNTAASSGTSSNHSNVGLPLSSSIAHRPVRTE